jgi:NitT/TauT family transport system ATP-binding protein
MQQRVSIARALSFDPALLLMDEPFGALDEMTRERLNLELLRIWQASGKTVVLVTHSIEEALLLGDRVVVFTPRPGRIQDVVEVPLPRPRSAKTRTDPVFVRLADKLRGYFETGAADVPSIAPAQA